MFTGVCLSVRRGVGYLWSQVPSWGGGRVSLVPLLFGEVGYPGVWYGGGAVGDPGGRIYPGVRYLKVALGSFHSNYGSSSPLCYRDQWPENFPWIGCD